MTGRMAGKVAAITGASRSLGLVFARTLAREGASVVLLARASKDLDAAQAEIPGSLALPCDVRSPDSVRQAFAAITERFGRLDALVNNAAALSPALIEEITDAHLWSEVETNLLGPILCAREAIPLLRAAGGGDIVNISSVVIEGGRTFLTLYAAAKAGLENLSVSLAIELRKDKIRVTTLRSGPLTGGGISSGWSPEIKARFEAIRQETGIAAAVGAPIAPEITAETLLHVLTMPPEARIGALPVIPF